MRRKEKVIDTWIKQVGKQNADVASILERNYSNLENHLQKEKPTDLKSMINAVMRSGLYADVLTINEANSAVMLVRDAHIDLANDLNQYWCEVVAYKAEMSRTDITDNARLQCFVKYDGAYNKALESFGKIMKKIGETKVNVHYDIT
jgi:hypothetical protein